MCKWVKTYTTIIGGEEVETTDSEQATSWIQGCRTVKHDYAPSCSLDQREKIMNPNHKYCQFCGTKIELTA